MADQVKEIFAGTITTADVASTGSYTLATTDSTTQFVIKDVTIDGVFISTPKLKINTTNVASLNKSVSGSEIVDVSSTIKYSLSDSAVIFQADVTVGFDNTTKKVTNTSTGIIAGVREDTVTTVQVVGTNSLTNYSQTVMFAQASDGDLFHAYSDGDSTNVFYKHSKTGSTTTIQTLGYGWAVYDGADTVYYVNANSPASYTTLYKYNIHTETVTTVSMPSSISQSSYPHALMTNNNKIVSSATGLGTATMCFIDPAADTMTYVATGSSWPNKTGTQYNGSVYYDAITNRYTIWRRGTTSLQKTVLNGELIIGQTYSGGVTNTTFSLGEEGSITSSNIRYSAAGSDADSFTQIRRNQSGTADKNVYTGSDLRVIPSYLPYGVQAAAVTDMVALKTANDFPASVNVRVTGIQITL